MCQEKNVEPRIIQYLIKGNRGLGEARLRLHRDRRGRLCQIKDRKLRQNQIKIIDANFRSTAIIKSVAKEDVNETSQLFCRGKKRSKQCKP